MQCIPHSLLGRSESWARRMSDIPNVDGKAGPPWQAFTSRTRYTVFYPSVQNVSRIPSAMLTTPDPRSCLGITEHQQNNELRHYHRDYQFKFVRFLTFTFALGAAAGLPGPRGCNSRSRQSRPGRLALPSSRYLSHHAVRPQARRQHFADGRGRLRQNPVLSLSCLCGVPAAGDETAREFLFDCSQISSTKLAASPRWPITIIGAGTGM